MATSWIAFHVTERCALRCRHCLRDPPRPPADLPVSTVERVLDQAIALHGVEHVGFTGGEPLLHPELGSAIDAAVRRGLGWHVVTSGRDVERLLALLAGDARRRAALTVVDLSLDGADAAVHDRVRGEGSYRAVLAAALALRAREIPFHVQMTVHAENAHQVEALAIEAAKLGAARVSIGMALPSGTPADRELWLSAAAWGEVRARVERLAEILAVPVGATEGFARRQAFHVCAPWRSETLHVDPRGRLTVCCMLAGTPGGDEDVIADLATTPLAAAHRLLLAHVQRLERERLEAVSGGVGPWDAFPCNWCARRHGRPHWVEGGSAGPTARRAGRAGT
jgi:MoaA/NifB/PqqE/SkfB family radical SAM enzyme